MAPFAAGLTAFMWLSLIKGKVETHHSVVPPSKYSWVSGPSSCGLPGPCSEGFTAEYPTPNLLSPVQSQRTIVKINVAYPTDLCIILIGGEYFDGGMDGVLPDACQALR